MRSCTGTRSINGFKKSGPAPIMTRQRSRSKSSHADYVKNLTAFSGVSRSFWRKISAIMGQ
jgi:hypothetical protein